ncbi:hypothetical protein Aduo_015613 [Ancylostoma duodenale]
MPQSFISLEACSKNDIDYKYESTSTGIFKCADFAQQLLRLGESGSAVDANTDSISFTPDFCNLMNSPEEKIAKGFSGISINFRNHQWLCDRAILAPMNDGVNQINTEI